MQSCRWLHRCQACIPTTPLTDEDDHEGVKEGLGQFERLFSIVWP